MINIQQVRRNVERMLRQFPSEAAVLYRPEVDAYGQPGDERTWIGDAEIWREGLNRPSKWSITASGERFESDSAIWVCLLIGGTTPEARHGDIVVMSDGTEYTVKNIQNNDVARIYWQLADKNGVNAS